MNIVPNPIEPRPSFTTQNTMKGSKVARNRVLIENTPIRDHDIFFSLLLFTQLQSNNTHKHINQAKFRIEQWKYLSACITQFLLLMTLQITSMHGRERNHLLYFNGKSAKYSLSNILPHLHIIFSMANMTLFRSYPGIILHE